jgi:hypothetical protein
MENRIPTRATIIWPHHIVYRVRCIIAFLSALRRADETLPDTAESSHGRVQDDHWRDIIHTNTKEGQDASFKFS